MKLSTQALALIASVSLFGIAACSSVPNQTPPPPPKDQVTVDPISSNKINVEFQGKCAMDVAHGLMTHLGKAEYHVDYKGKTYFFETAQERDAFIANIDANVKQANLRWAQGQINTDHGDRVSDKTNAH